MQWERDYVDYRKNMNRSGRGRSRSVAEKMSSGGICGCFGKGDDYLLTEDAEENRAATTRLAGYKTGYHDSIIEMENLEGKKKKKKKKKDGENDSGEIAKNGLADIVDEAEIDDMYQEEFEVNGDNDVILGHNKKKLKAVEILLEACKNGMRLCVYSNV